MNAGISLDWALTLLCVHLMAALICAALYKTAPCWMQKLSMFGLFVSMSVFSVGYLIHFVETAFPDLGWWGGWQVALLALVIEHIAVLLYVFRLAFKGKPKWAKSSEVSQPWPG